MTGAASTVTAGPYHHATREQLRAGAYPIAVYGLGKIGLPVAGSFAELTGAVVGVDIDEAVVETVEAGGTPFAHEPGLDALLERTVADGSLRATSAVREAATAASIHVIVVPVLLGAGDVADLSALDAVLEDIGAGLSAGDLVVIESTVPPGTCADRVEPALRAASGLASGTFGVASCPERTQSGEALANIRGTYPRVVGGVDAHSTAAAAVVYGELVDNEIVTVSNARTAEAVKLFEGVYRDVNIALANELALTLDGTEIDVRESIAAANTQPFCDLHEPGAGVGGHCIPYYPYFLMQATSHGMPLVQTGRLVNDHMPVHLAEVTLAALDHADVPADEATIAVLGLSYRPGIAETAATPALPLIQEFDAAGVTVYAIDPVIDDWELDTPRLEVDDLSGVAPDAIVLVTAHEEFATIPWEDFEGCVIIDGRDAIPSAVDRTYTVGRGTGHE